MVRIARRVPAVRDAEVAAVAPTLLISQLDRLLRSLPEQPDGSTERPEPERMCRVRESRDGWTRGEFCLPADEGAVFRAGLVAGRDAEFRDRNGLDDTDPADAEAPAPGARAVSWADGLVRLASEGLDALDPECRRTGHRGERALVVLHFDIDPDGALGPGQIDLGPVIPDTIARYLACDARVQVMTYQAGQPHRHQPRRTHRQPGDPPLPVPPRPRLHPPALLTTSVAARTPHPLVDRRRPDRGPEPRPVVPHPPPGAAPRRLHDRRRPRSRHPPVPRPLGPPHRRTRSRPTRGRRPTSTRPTRRRRSPRHSPNASPPTPSPGTDGRPVTSRRRSPPRRPSGSWRRRARPETRRRPRAATRTPRPARRAEAGTPRR